MSQELRNNLEQLHAELSRHPQLDPQAVESLRKLMSEISEAIEHSTASSTAQASAPSSDFAGQVETLVARFKSRHPQLTATLSNLASALADLGI